MSTTSNLSCVVRAMPLERVHFFDGMILDAEDLEAEREYHLARSRLINRAVFGCGIACGLKVEKHPADEQPTRFVCVQPGIAFDCAGDPFELCRPLKLDLDPDPCKEPPKCVCVLIRRRNGVPRASDDRGCDKVDKNEPRRVREGVEICVVPCAALPDGVCRLPPKSTASHAAGDCEQDGHQQDAKDDLCTCLKECESCDPCGEGWVLLACVNLEPPAHCPGPERDRWAIEDVDGSYRKYIKPIRCFCPPERTDRPTEQEECWSEAPDASFQAEAEKREDDTQQTEAEKKRGNPAVKAQRKVTSRKSKSRAK